MSFEKTWMLIDTAVNVINRAANDGIINRREAEILIQNIYHEADKNPFKTP